MSLVLTLKVNPTWDREVGIDPSALALTASNIKLQVIDIDNVNTLVYDNTGAVANIEKATGFSEILGTILIKGKLTAKPDYNPATKKILFYDAGGNVTTVTAAHFPIRLLVIGV